MLIDTWNLKRTSLGQWGSFRLVQKLWRTGHFPEIWNTAQWREVIAWNIYVNFARPCLCRRRQVVHWAALCNGRRFFSTYSIVSCLCYYLEGGAKKSKNFRPISLPNAIRVRPTFVCTTVAFSFLFKNKLSGDSRLNEEI